MTDNSKAIKEAGHEEPHGAQLCYWHNVPHFKVILFGVVRQLLFVRFYAK